MVVIVIFVLLAGGFFLFSKNYSTTVTQSSPSRNTQSSPAPTNTQAISKTRAQQTQNTVTYTTNGFSPVTLTIKSDTTVTWVNKSSEQVVIGVNPHPIHSGDRTITNEKFTLNLAPDESKTVTVNKTGTFGYHNHLNPGQTGTIIAQ